MQQLPMMVKDALIMGQNRLRAIQTGTTDWPNRDLSLAIGCVRRCVNLFNKAGFVVPRLNCPYNSPMD